MCMFATPLPENFQHERSFSGTEALCQSSRFRGTQAKSRFDFLYSDQMHWHFSKLRAASYFTNKY